MIIFLFLLLNYNENSNYKVLKMKENDENKFTEEFNKNMKNIEGKLLKLINTKELKLNEKINELQIKINSTVEKNEIAIKNYSNQQLDHKKILELEVFKNKVDSMLITHELRINNNINDLIKFQSKYDKIIVDNLLLPGFIGPSCQFRNLGEYISSNITDISKIKSEKEQIKKDTKDVKTKIDSIMKQMIVLNDCSIERCKEYTDNKQKDIENMINVKMEEFSAKITEIRALFSQFQNQINEQIDTFNSELLKVFNMKGEITNYIDEKYIEFQKNINDVHKKVVLNIQDIGILKRKVNEINEINTYNKKKYSSKNNNFLKKENVKSFQDTFNSNLIEMIKNREDGNLKRNKGNTISAKINNKNESEFVALNFDLNGNLFTINNNLDLKNIPNKKENENKLDFKKVNLYNKEKIIKSELSSKKKNLIIDNNKENNLKTDSFDNLIEPKFMSIFNEPYILDQKILSDADLKIQKEKRTLRKEIIKKKLQKNLYNLRVISGNNLLDLYNYSTSIPKIDSYPKRGKSREDLDNKKKINNIEEIKKKHYSIKSKTLNDIKYEKSNLNNNYKLVNLELEEKATINPDTNNGAYVLAHKQIENNNISKVNITPTSYVNVYNISKKSTRLMNMTFAKEEPPKIKKSFVRIIYDK